MKILWFTNTPCGSVRRYGGSSVSGGWLISLEDELKKNPKVDLHVAYFAPQKEIPFKYEGVTYYPMGYERKKNSIERILYRRKSITKIDKERLPWMLDVIEQCQPDIIHIHGSEDSFITILPHIKNIPVVVSIQGMIAPICEKYFSGISDRVAMKNESFRDMLHSETVKIQFKSLYNRARREEQYMQQVKYIIGRTFLDENYTSLLNPDRKYFVVNEIIRPEFYNVQWKGFINPTQVNLVSTISGAIYKGIETILKSANLLKKYYKNKFEWHIVGYDAQSKWVKVAEKMTGIQIENCNLVFHGRMDAHALSNLLSDSDIYVNASHIENSPNSVCEAMLVGMPIIATYAGGTASLLTHEEDGILVQDGDPYAMAGAIVNFVKHKDKAEQYADSARRKAVERHAPSRILKDLINCYQLIIDDFTKEGMCLNKGKEA